MDASSDVLQLWVALTPEQVRALNDGNALPDERSGRFGLRATAVEALERAQYFMNWTKEGPDIVYPHSAFTVCHVNLTALGYVKKMEGNVLQKMGKPGEFRWWGALKREEFDERDRLLCRVSESAAESMGSVNARVAPRFLGHVRLWVALTTEQLHALSDRGALPDESSARFGLRATAAEVVLLGRTRRVWKVQGRNHVFHRSGAFVVCRVHLTTLGYVKKMEGNVLQKMGQPGEYRWWGALKREERCEAVELSHPRAVRTVTETFFHSGGLVKPTVRRARFLPPQEVDEHGQLLVTVSESVAGNM
ncbi:unnamed protein product [Effrenium voratum]|nr:unnamed protein product [Effrenium voratum]